MNIRPLGERVVVKIAAADTKTAGGLFIPQSAQEKTQEGVVKAIGDSDKITVKVNDKVIHDKYAGTKLEMNGEELLILKMEDIIAKVE